MKKNFVIIKLILKSIRHFKYFLKTTISAIFLKNIFEIIYLNKKKKIISEMV